MHFVFRCFGGDIQTYSPWGQTWSVHGPWSVHHPRLSTENPSEVQGYLKEREPSGSGGERKGEDTEQLKQRGELGAWKKI